MCFDFLYKFCLKHLLIINRDIIINVLCRSSVDLQEVGGGCEDWMELAQDRDRWRALVSTVMNLRVFQKCGEFLD